LPRIKAWEDFSDPRGVGTKVSRLIKAPRSSQAKEVVSTTKKGGDGETHQRKRKERLESGSRTKKTPNLQHHLSRRLGHP